MFRRGLWVNLLNPKAVVFFLAFMPQFIRPEQPLLPQYLVLSATVIVIDILVMWFFFAAAATVLPAVHPRRPRAEGPEPDVRGLFVGVGVLLALIH